ncbi:MAG: sarcosine oxidase subunit beta, partial [Betaproteobacteria bacterium]
LAAARGGPRDWAPAWRDAEPGTRYDVVIVGGGGFKAIPVGGWTLAYALATGHAHELAAPFGLDRFITGRLIDEAGAAGIAH